MKITHKITGAVIHETAAETIREVLLDAVKNKINLAHADLRYANLSGANLRCADLRYANLSGANLSDANLSGANLSGADLSGANLRCANLSDADLSGADLSGANLSGADLRGANLSDADLSGADLRYANLSGADLIGANLSGADLSGANLSDANLSGAKGITAPVIEDIDGRILKAIEAGGKLEMGQWHTCETTHCRAGWAIHFAGDFGKSLEERIGPSAAGALIYWASCKRIPNFFATNKEAMEDIRKGAAK